MKYLVTISILVGLAPFAFARTWTVSVDGSGDAPNLYAAMDSAATGDSVLVGPGNYPLPERLTVDGGVSLIGKNGPAETHLEALGSDIPTSGITLNGEMDGIHLFGVSNFLLTVYGEVRRCIIEGEIQNFTVSVFTSATLQYNVFVNGELAIYNASAQFAYNIIGAHITSPGPIDCCFLSNDVFGPVDPNVTIRSQELNFFLDPQFCGVPGSGNYYLKSTSPCLPGNNPYGVPLAVGPLGVGCGAVTVKTTTWGAVKALYGSKR